MDLLLLFVMRSGELITREEIVAALWELPQSVDVRQGINTAITRLRAVLGDNPSSPRYLETVIGKGYRFIATVEELDKKLGSAETVSGSSIQEVVLDERLVSLPAQPQSFTLTAATPIEDAEPSTSHPSPAVTAVPSRKRVSRTWGLVAMFVLCALAGAWWRVHSHRVSVAHELSASPDSSVARPGTHSKIRSLAVVPVVNLSDDREQQYFADGLTDELISNLAATTGLRVTSRASSMHLRGVDRSSGEMARELGVDALVESSVRREGSRLRVTAHLVDAREDRDVWSHSYDLPASSSSTVVDTISQAVRLQISYTAPRRTAPAVTVNQDAYENYLRGRYEWNKRTSDGLIRAIKYFKQSIAADPQFASAHAGLADAELLMFQHFPVPVLEALARARPEAEKAIQLDPGLAEAHTTIGNIHQISYEWNEAEREFRVAISLDPSYATGHQWYSDFLSLVGRHDEAVEQAKLAIQSDPLSPMIQTQLGIALYYARRYDQAIAALRKALEMEPGFHEALVRLGTSYAMQGKYAEALDALHQTDSPAIESFVEALAGNKERAAAIARNIEREEHDSMDLFLATLPLNNKTRSFQLLQEGVKLREASNIGAEPVLDPLRSDPRFAQAVALLHLPPPTR